MFGLVDGNNFYASCERVFNPALCEQPVCILSNNDGCAIARSQECKDLGVRMGQPFHEVDPHIRRQLKILSANFALYGDLSGRVVSVLRHWFPRVEVYSIDEVKSSARIRDKMRRIDLDTITFETGSSDIAEDQVQSLKQVGQAIKNILDKDPG